MRRLTSLTVGITVLLLTATPPALGVAPLTLGFSADSALTAGTPSSRTPWIQRAISEGASIVRLNVDWAQVAPARPSQGFVPADPSSPGYDWSAVDGAVSDLARHGLRVLLTLADAPAWAEGPGRPADVQPGSWKPDPRQFGMFAAAAARRYDGSFPDPRDPSARLPRVTLWQAWNEPNLDYYLAPQWVRTRSGYSAVAPTLYRSLLNAFYSAVKQVSRADLVLMGGTSPYGEPPGTFPLGAQRTAPAAFYRSVFCLTGTTRLSAVRCPDPAHLDAIDHHPYGVGGPTWHAVNPDDVAVPDIEKLVRVLRAAQDAGTILPRGRKGIWVSELGWSSRPPNPKGVPVNEDARWLEQAMYVLWSQGVDTILPLELADPASITDYSAVFESGLYYSDGKPKPLADAYRFPFVARRLSGSRVLVWGRAPELGRLEIQVLRDRRWATIAGRAVGARVVFVIPLRIAGATELRGADGTQTSLSWRVGA